MHKGKAIAMVVGIHRHSFMLTSSMQLLDNCHVPLDANLHQLLMCEWCAMLTDKLASLEAGHSADSAQPAYNRHLQQDHWPDLQA